MRIQSGLDKRSSEDQRFEPNKKLDKNYGVSFGDGAGVSAPKGGSWVVNTMESIARGGLVVSFCLQDGLGCILPRFGTGLTRNKKETGEINIKFAMEEFLREFLTGPGMFAVPATMLWFGKKYFGAANDVPIDYIKQIGGIFKSGAEKYSGITDAALQKEAFYTDVFKDILSASAKDDSSASDFAKALMDVEKAPSKGFWKNYRGIPVEGSTQDLLQSLKEKFIALRKASSESVTEDLNNVKMKNFDKETSFNRFVDHMKNYANDAISTLNKEKPSNLSEFFESFNLKRAGSRSLLNIAMTAGVFAFISIVPKLYKINKTYPGTLGHDKLENANKKDAEKSGKQEAANVSFSGLEKLGKSIFGSSKLHSFFDNIEYSGISMSFPTLVAICASVPIPRLATSRDENDFWDTVGRDIPTILTILFGVRAIKNVLADIYSKSTGFALASKPSADTGFFSKTFSNRAFGGEYIASRYTNIHQFKNGMAEFLEFVKAQGGDVKKVIDFDNTVKSAAEDIYKTANKADKKEFSALSGDELIDMFKNVDEAAKPHLEKIYEVFKNPKNVFVDRAKLMNSKFDFLAMILLVPVCLGMLIPKMNEYLSKRRTIKKMENDKAGADQDAAANVAAKELNEPVFKAFSSKPA